jgi:hypothetical protein
VHFWSTRLALRTGTSTISMNAVVCLCSSVVSVLNLFLDPFYHLNPPSEHLLGQGNSPNPAFALRSSMCRYVQNDVLCTMVLFSRHNKRWEGQLTVIVDFVGVKCGVIQPYGQRVSSHRAVWATGFCAVRTLGMPRRYMYTVALFQVTMMSEKSPTCESMKTRRDVHETGILILAAQTVRNRDS